MAPSHDDDLALIERAMGTLQLKAIEMSVKLTLRTVAPHQLEIGYKTVIHLIADQIRQRMNGGGST